MTLPDLRAADARFLLPRPPGSVTLLGSAAPSGDAWSAAGVSVSTEGGDCVVGAAEDIAAALRAKPEMLLIHGKPSRRRLAAAGYRSARVLALPGPTAPRLLVPLGSPASVRAALSGVGRAQPLPAVLRAGALAFLERGIAPARSVITVAAREAPRPWLLDRVDGHAEAWYLWLGGGDPLQRAVLHLVAADGGQTVKFSRVPRDVELFRREQAMAGAAAGAPSAVARHVPVPLGYGTDTDLPYGVETRFAGRPMTEALASRRPRSHKLDLVQAVADWLHEMAVATRTPPAALDDERTRLARKVVPEWVGTPADLLDAVADVPGVLTHNDAGAWNIVVDSGGGFGVVDWESASNPGLPFWDLTYFLADALTLVEHGAAGDRTPAMLELFRGRSPLSGLLFGNVRRLADALGVAPAAVASAVTLGWMHHGLSLRTRTDNLVAHAHGAKPARAGPVGGLAGPWLRDPDLGTGWAVWR